jgi:hypothetical protein
MKSDLFTLFHQDQDEDEDLGIGALRRDGLTPRAQLV